MNNQEKMNEGLANGMKHSAFKIVTTKEKTMEIEKAQPIVWKDYINDIVKQRRTLFKKLKHQREMENIKNRKIVKTNNRRTETNVVIIPPHNSTFFNNYKLKKIRRNEKVKEALVHKEKSADTSSSVSKQYSETYDGTVSPTPIRRMRRSKKSSSKISTDYKSKKSPISTFQSNDREYSNPNRFGPRGKYKMYTDEERETIFRYAEEYGAKQAVKMFGIDRRRIKRWMEKGSCRNIGGQGRSPLNVGMEEKLVKEIENHCYSFGKYPKRKLIKKWALDFYEGDGEFKASKGWFDKFFRRNKDILQPLKDEY